MPFFSKIFGDANERYIRSLRPLVDGINGLEPLFQKLSDDQLKAKSQEFRDQLAKGKTLDELLPEAFAAVREASRRVSGQRHFDVQLMGGIILHRGKIAEMRTGEGKTLVATLPAYLNALESEGVHIVTVNDYLSRRDTVWMGQIYNALGLTVGCLNHDSSYLYDPRHKTANSEQSTANSAEDTALDRERDITGGFRVVHEFLRPVSRSEAYKADITYGTNNEFGFDYLRDNLVYDERQLVQSRSSSDNQLMKDRGSSIQSEAESGRSSGHHYAIVDEVDSILIDEARTPLIISAPDEESTKLYETFSRAVPSLAPEQDYTVDEKRKAVSITDSGIEKIERMLGLKDIYAEGGVRYVHHLEQALKAHVFYKRDRNYVVKDGEVIIVDDFTGRLMPGRRWSEGLHQAVEAKEGVRIQKESRTLATVTFQNYFRMYRKLAGMTGTARTSAEEFHKVYGLDVITAPTHKAMVRVDASDRIYKTEAGKFRALVREIRERNTKFQPVLVGTVSIEKNELLSAMLEREGIPHNVLNAKNHEKEAEIIAQAGRLSAVTVATNMAGRGVDIILGGNPSDAAEAAKVREAGGLHVIGTERHEARRIDDQLRGRSGRQGDPGSSQFFVSTEDELIRVFGGDRLKNIMERLGIGEDETIENRFVSSAIQQAQAKVEGHNFDARKYVLEYDDVVNKHRETIYRLRREALSSRDERERILGYCNNYAEQAINAYSATEGEPDVDALAQALTAAFPFGNNLTAKLRELGSAKAIIDYVHEELDRLYDLREKEFGVEQMRMLERMVLLRTIDELWTDHLDAIEYLRDTVQLRAYGQRDPLVEYKIEGQRMFDQLMNSIEAQVANLIFRVSFMAQPKRQVVQERGPLDISTPEQGPHAETIPLSEKKTVGRNDPCPCGSGKKYKRCHGK